MVLKKSKPKKSNMTSLYTLENLTQMAEEYNEISKHIKALESTKKALADKIKAGAEALGVKDDRGSYSCDAGDFTCGKIAKKSISLNEEKAKNLFNLRGCYSRFVKPVTVEKIDESELAKAVQDGTFTPADIEAISDIKVSYQVSVTKKTELPEVEVTTFAASKKK